MSESRSIFRANSVLARRLGASGKQLVEVAANTLASVLPHVSISKWREIEGYSAPGATAVDQTRRQLNVRFGFRSANPQEDGRTLCAVAQRYRANDASDSSTVDLREQDLCRKVAERVGALVRLDEPHSPHQPETLAALAAAFEEQVIAAHFRDAFGWSLDVGGLLRQLHVLAGQTYENSALTFGALIEPEGHDGQPHAQEFPGRFMLSKKYRALSDGYRTAYRITRDGFFAGFLRATDLCVPMATSPHHFFPEWSRDLATASRFGRVGVCLTNQGDILVFTDACLRFAYRAGRWQYWNHGHLVDVLATLARRSRVPRSHVKAVTRGVYRAAVDAAFRRHGALFVVLAAEKRLMNIVRSHDVIGSVDRDEIDDAFDAALPGSTLRDIPREILVELSALDGATVFSGTGKLLAYGAVLQPRKKGRLGGTEGARTKAAIGASHEGVALKVSSDGDITIFHQGKEVMSI